MENNITLNTRNPVTQSNIFSKLLFIWCVKLYNKSSKYGLKVKDLYISLTSDRSDHLADALERNWNEEIRNSKAKNSDPSLLRAIRKTFAAGYMVHGILVFFAFGIIRPVQPLILSLFLKLFTKDIADDDEENLKYMCIYGGSIILISFVLLFLNHHTNLLLAKEGMRVRIACCSLIYRKMLKLNQESIGKSGAGQVVNMLSNDVSRFDLLSIMLHYFWVMPIQIVIVTYFIWEQVQLAAAIGIGALFLMTIPVHAVVGKLSSVLRLNIAKRTDERVKRMAEIISGIQVIKMYAWESSFAEVVNTVRKREIKLLTLVSYIRGVISSSSVFIERLILFITVVAYVLLGNTITADKVFSMAQFFNILQLSMAIYFPMAVTVGAEALISIKRLKEFLMLEEISNTKIVKDESKNIILENVDASWVSGVPVLRDISINIPQGKLCAVIGPVGAGKSSLLQMLLGELVFNSGSVTVGGDISYSSQEAWLFASTVRKNILFGEPYDPVLYKKVVKACSLERDFELFPQGDKTMVGERGVSLSGGQKARINLARAVYRNVDIYLMDDPLSAVDTHVGKQLFENCINGYLRNKTRILVTHQLQYLRKADHIVVINEGKIEAQGTFNELAKADSEFTKLLIQSDETDSNPSEENKLSLENETVLEKNAETKSPTRRSIRRSPSVYSTLTNPIAELTEIDEYEEEQEEASTKYGFSAYTQYAKAGGNICMLLILLILLIGGQVSSNVGDLFLTYWTDTETERVDQEGCTRMISLRNFRRNVFNASTSATIQQPYAAENCNEDLMSTNMAMIIYSVIIGSSIILLILRSLYYFKLAMRASQKMHNKMFSSLLRVPMKFFDTNPSGRILNRFSRDMGMMDEILPKQLVDALQIFLVMIGILVMVFITNWYMIIIALVLGIFFNKLRKWYIVVARDIKQLEGITRSPVFSHLSASFNGITTIRSASREKTLMQEFDWHQDTHTSAWYITLVSISAFGLWLDFLSFTFLAATVVSFVIIFQFGIVSGSAVGLALSQSLILTGMVQFGIRQTAEVVSQMTSVERILDYTNLEAEEPQKTPKENLAILDKWPSLGEIKFVKVFLRYAENDAPVLNNLNFVITAKNKIGIVGRTGAGKSSLITALFRLTKVEGEILIDQVDTGNIGLNDLRKRISIIPQEPVLFSASLRYNLDPFNEFSDKEIWAALEEVELKDVAASLDFFVQEGGSNFSVGQRQLVCLARAILRSNKILVLDEATANVDPQTDELIQKTIRTKFKDCTVLTIAHRLNTIMDTDKVLVMDAGQLVEYDHPHILLQNSDGYFYKMVEQTGETMAKNLHSVAEATYNAMSDNK